MKEEKRREEKRREGKRREEKRREEKRREEKLILIKGGPQKKILMIIYMAILKIK